MQTFIVIAILCIICVLAYIRFAPSYPNSWHVKPSNAQTSGRPNEFRLVGENAIVFDLPVSELSILVADFIEAQERVEVLIHETNKTHVTYIQKTKIMGYPDYISVEIIDIGKGQSKLEILSRSRFGYSDLGVNKRRIDDWIAAVNALVMRR